VPHPFHPSLKSQLDKIAHSNIRHGFFVFFEDAPNIDNYCFKWTTYSQVLITGRPISGKSRYPDIFEFGYRIGGPYRVAIRLRDNVPNI
jgi:hypothetical protein